MPTTASARASSVSVAGLLATLLGCTSCGRTTHAPTATDASSFDAATDTIDASTTDSGVGYDVFGDTPVVVDADPDSPVGGQWMSIPGLPVQCGEVLAVDPQSVPATEWLPCDDGRSGCRRLVNDWGSPTYQKLLVNPEAVRLIGGIAYLSYERQWRSFETIDYSLGIVQPIDGAPLAAVRFRNATPDCFFTLQAGDRGIALVGGISPGNDSSTLIATSTWNAPNAFTATIVTKEQLHGFGEWFATQRFSVGANDLFLEVVDPDVVAPFSMSTATLVPNPPAAELPYAIRGGALALSFANPIGVMILRDNGTHSVFTAEGGRLPTWVSVDHANDDALVWVESDPASAGFEYLHPTIWTAPWTLDASAVARRKVATYEDGGNGGRGMVVNAGMALEIVDDHTLRLTRLSDGQGWAIDAGTNLKVCDALWVDDDEVWFTTEDASIIDYEPSGIVRLQRSVLGAPMFPSGL